MTACCEDNNNQLGSADCAEDQRAALEHGARSGVIVYIQ